MGIDRPNPTLDTYNQPVRGWLAVTSSWSAAIEPLNGREYFRAQETQADARVRIRLRYGSEISAISEEWRITHEGRYYNILSVIKPAEINQEYVLMCSEGVSHDGG